MDSVVINIERFIRGGIMKASKYLKYLLISVLAALALITSACTTPDNGGNDRMTEEEARQMAENFVKNSPTFTFDGIEDTLQLVETLYPDIENAWQFVFQFESRQAGYGDRTGQMLLQVITPHEAIVTVEHGEVTSAVLDGNWDMKEQRFIDGEGVDGARQIAEEFVRNSPTFVFDGIGETLELVNIAAFSRKTISQDTPSTDAANGWVFTFGFDSATAGYGDRTGQMVAEVITPHVAVVTVENNEVISAVMDEKWDMINQQMLDEVEISLAPIHEVEVLFMESFPVQVGVHIKGGLRDGCTTFNDAVVTREGDTINIEVTTQRPRDAICTQVYGFFEENLNLGSDFAPGTTYTLDVNDYTTTFLYQ
jgi:hypothetical protein